MRSLLAKVMFYLQAMGLKPRGLIHLIPKWRPFLYSFVYFEISPFAWFGKLVFDFEFRNEATRANLQVNKRKLRWRPSWNKVNRRMGPSSR